MTIQPPNEEAIFQIAREIKNLTKRAAYLDQACGGDQDLRKRVDALLDSHESETDFLKSNDRVATTSGPTLQRNDANQQVGPYKIREQIGEGGMGIVYVAEQQSPVRRKVALKVIKPGMDSNEVVARFDAERQALAMMDHPGIAKVFDGGVTETGQPYFAMELINGIPITQYCDEQKLGIRERLELFVSVCNAVQHAHQKGVIHRDIKPTNVLVTLHDGKPVPVVIDFGVAKATNQNLTDQTIYTRLHQVVGTTLYMSPEQAELSRFGVDTRTDIYSLGVLLYEMLAGTTPFDRERFKQAALDEVRRIIREEEPPKPSTRLSTFGDAATKVSSLRRTDPKKLRHCLQGDLDWIVMMALEKDRKRRYETSNGLAMDITRFLDDEPILARPPSTWYRIQKFYSRNKALATTSLVIVLAITAGLAAAVWGRNQAIIAAETAKGANRRLVQEDYNLKISNAFQALASGDFDRLRKLLDDCDHDLRGFEWHLLDDQLQRKTTPAWAQSFGADEQVNDIALSANGDFAILGLSNGEICLLDTSTGSMIGERKKLNINSVSFRKINQLIWNQNNDRVIAAGAFEKNDGGLGGLIVFEVTANSGTFNIRSVREKQVEHPVHSIDLHPTQPWLAIGSAGSLANKPQEEFAIGIADLSKPDLAFLWAPKKFARKAYKSQVWVCFCNSFLASFVEGNRPADAEENDTTVAFRRIKDGERVGNWDVGFRIDGIDYFAPDKKLVASTVVGIHEAILRFDDRPEVVAERRIPIRSNLPEFAKVDDTLVVADQYGGILCINHQTGNEELRLQHRTSVSTIRCHALSDDGETLITAGRFGELKCWRLSQIVPQKKVGVTELNAFHKIGLSSSCDKVVFRGGDRQNNVVRVWNHRLNSEMEFPVKKHQGWVWDADISPDNQWLATSGRDGRVVVWNLTSGEEVSEIKLEETPHRKFDVQFLPASESDTPILAVGTTGKVQLWDPWQDRDSELPGTDKKWNYITLAVSPDGKYLAAGGGSWGGYYADDDTGETLIWNLSSKQLVKRISHKRIVYEVTFSPDSRYCAAAGLDPKIKIFDIDDEKLIPIDSATWWHTGLSYTSDGRRLVTASQKGEIQFWNPETGKLVGQFHVNDQVRRIYFLPENEGFITSATEGNIRVWKLRKQDEVLE